MYTARQCLAALTQLRDCESSDARREILRRVTDLFLVTAGLQGPGDSAVFGEVMGQLAFALDEEARKELSHRIAEREQTPRELSVRLGSDVISVAGPILEHCPSLTDQDLIDIAKARSDEHRQAIARRSSLSMAVTDVLLERGARPVIETLIRNHGAQFSFPGFKVLARRVSDSLESNEALIERRDVPDEVLAQATENMSKKFNEDLAAGRLALSLDKLAAPETARGPAQKIDPQRARYRAEIDHLHLSRELKEDTVYRFAQARQPADVAYAVTLLSGLDGPIVCHCIFEGPAPTIAILCKSLAFNRGTFWSMLQLRKTAGAVAGTFAVDASNLFNAIDTGLAQRVLRFLKFRLKAGLFGQGLASPS